MYTFIFFCNIMIPLIMIVLGFIFEHKPPKTINGTAGFRTYLSMRNQETWDYANKRAGQLYRRVFEIVLIPSAIVAIIIKPCSELTQTIVCMVLLIVQCIVAVLIKNVVQKELKEKF